MWNSGDMTTSSKSGHVRDVAVHTGGAAVRAAKLYAAGPAAVGFHVARKGYGLARSTADKRAPEALRPVSPATRRTTRRRRVLVFGSLAGLAVAFGVVSARRRSTFVPPADAPPSLDDYADSSPLT